MVAAWTRRITLHVTNYQDILNTCTFPKNVAPKGWGYRIWDVQQKPACAFYISWDTVLPSWHSRMNFCPWLQAETVEIARNSGGSSVFETLPFKLGGREPGIDRADLWQGKVVWSGWGFRGGPLVLWMIFSQVSGPPSSSSFRQLTGVLSPELNAIPHT